MNEDANDPDEFIEAAPEDDDFSDYEAAENENPEAVQAMIGGPSWIFPDLVQRVQSSPPAGNVDANLSEQQQQQLQSRSSPAAATAAAASDLTASTCQPSTSRGSAPRALDPPDVSLLTCPGNANSNCSASSSNTQQQQQQPNTIDLCNSIRQGSKLNFSSSGYISAASKNGGGSSHSATSSPPSNSVGSSSSSSSGASSLSTNISGLVLSSTSSLSSSAAAAAANGALMNNGVHRGSADNSDAFPDFNLPSTSAASTQKQLNSMEREIRVLEEEKVQLAQQLVRKDDELEEMRQSLSSMRLSSNGTTAAAAAPANSSPPTEGAIVRRIEHLFEQMSSNIQNSLAAFERRIESLESRQMLHASSGGASSSSLHPPPSSSPQQLAQLMAECQRRINENQRQEMCSLFRNILTSAVGEIDSFSSLAPSASSSSSSPSTTATTTTTSESLLQQRQNAFTRGRQRKLRADQADHHLFF